jgi:hypothetical protein
MVYIDGCEQGFGKGMRFDVIRRECSMINCVGEEILW